MTGGPRDRDHRLTGKVLDTTRWDYEPVEDAVSPLVSTERYFRGFPWDSPGSDQGEMDEEETEEI